MRKLLLLLVLAGCGPGSAGAWQRIGHGVARTGEQAAWRRHERNLEFQRAAQNAFRR